MIQMAKQGQSDNQQDRQPHLKSASMGNDGHLSKSSEARFATRQAVKMANLRTDPNEADTSTDEKRGPSVKYFSQRLAKASKN